MIVSGPLRVLSLREATFLVSTLRAGRADLRRNGWRPSAVEVSLLEDLDTMARLFRESRASDPVGPIGPAPVGPPAKLGVSTTEAAQRLTDAGWPMGEHQVGKLIRAGRLPARRVQGKWVIDLDDLNDEIKRRST